jgi:hypothetical protein
MSIRNKTYASTVLAGNINIEDNVISSVNNNSNISILPNGVGEVLINADPISILGVATKQYVDAKIAGLTFKQPARVSTTVALPTYTQSGSGVGATLTATTNGSINNSGIDGITSLIINDRILVKSEGSFSDLHNGVYDLTQVGDISNPWVMTRSSDFDENVEVISGSYVLITSGVINSDISYVISTADPISVDSIGIEFVRFAPVTGEDNTVSNVGVGGIGLFKQKVDIDLEFKNINVSSTQLSITDDLVNNEVQIDFDQTQITGTGVIDSGSITSNFGNINIGTSTLDAGIITATQIYIDNIRIDANSIISTNTNGNINLTPNGVGEVILKADPINVLAATTKQYVDAVATGLDVKDSARVTTTIALPTYTQSGAGVGATLTATANGSINITGIDSITSLILNDRILVRSIGTTSDTHNGVYDLTQVGDGSNPWVLTRSTDFDETSKVGTGAYVLINDGVVFAGSAWTVTTSGIITIDTTAIIFSQFSTPTPATTASNIGVGGVGVFKQKLGNNLEFNTINSTTPHVTLALDPVDNEVELTFDQSQITGTGILNSGSITSGFGNINTGSSTITTTGAGVLGSLTVDQIVLDNSSVTFSGTTGTNIINIPNNILNAYTIVDSSVSYIELVSTTASQNIKLLQNTNVTGTLTTTGVVNGRNMVSDGNYIDSLISIGIEGLTALEVNQLENINSVVISNIQWGFLGALDQSLSTTDNVTFNIITGTTSINTDLLTVNEITLNNSSITLSGTTGDNLLLIPSNILNSFTITDSIVDYLTLDSTTGSQSFNILQNTDITGDLNVSSYIDLDEIAEPSHPGTTVGRLYKKNNNDGIFWKPDVAGLEVDLTTGTQYVRSAITNISSPYTILASDEIIGCDSSSGVVTVILPLISSIGGTNNYRKYHIVDEEGVSSINNIFVSTTGLDTINKNTEDLTIDIDHTSITVYSDGSSNWVIM